MSKIDIERLKYIKRPVGRPPAEDPMVQLSLRLPRWMIDSVDAINEHERYNQADRTGIIRELIAEALDNRKE